MKSEETKRVVYVDAKLNNFMKEQSILHAQAISTLDACRVSCLKKLTNPAMCEAKCEQRMKEFIDSGMEVNVGTLMTEMPPASRTSEERLLYAKTDDTLTKLKEILRQWDKDLKAGYFLKSNI